MFWEHSVEALLETIKPPEYLASKLALLKPWLGHYGSLTKLLQKLANEHELVIRLVAQSFRPVSLLKANEISGLQQIPTNTNELETILERIILMSVNRKPWLYARSNFTKPAIEYFGEELTDLGDNSLGELISKNYPRVLRSCFEYSMLTSDHSLYKEINLLLKNSNILANNLIIRRSLFKLNGKIVLFNLDEVFLPELINEFTKMS